MIITPDSPEFHQTRPNAEAELRAELAKRIMVIDGAMGTTIRGYGLDEQQTRGERFKNAPKDVRNNGDLLYLERGRDRKEYSLLDIQNRLGLPRGVFFYRVKTDRGSFSRYFSLL